MNIRVKEQGPIGRFADTLVVPIMYAVSGTFSETPQRTHFWNNWKISHRVASCLDRNMMVFIPGDSEACPRGVVKFHMPIRGGWRKYVVLEPKRVPQRGWHAGWTCADVCGISMVRLYGRVRLLIGPGDSWRFGLDCLGRQIPLVEVGRGIIGERDMHCMEPLL